MPSTSRLHTLTESGEIVGIVDVDAAVVVAAVVVAAVVAAWLVAGLGGEELVSADESLLDLLGLAAVLGLAVGLDHTFGVAHDGFAFNGVDLAGSLLVGSDSSALLGKDLGCKEGQTSNTDTDDEHASGDGRTGGDGRAWCESHQTNLSLVLGKSEAVVLGFRLDGGDDFFSGGGGGVVTANFGEAGSSFLGVSADAAVSSLAGVASTTVVTLAVAGLAGAAGFATVAAVAVVTAAVLTAVVLGVVRASAVSTALGVVAAAAVVTVTAVVVATAATGTVVVLLLGGRCRCGGGLRCLDLRGLVLVVRVQSGETVKVRHRESQSQKIRVIAEKCDGE